jgi:hypothetical protein
LCTDFVAIKGAHLAATADAASQVSVLEEISTGEVLLAAAKRSLKLMQDFVTAQQELLKPGGVPTLLAAAAAAAAGPSGSSGSSTKLAAATAAAGAAAAAGSKAAGGAVELSFEMVAALLNNTLDCYNQSLEFTEHVQVGRRQPHRPYHGTCPLHCIKGCPCCLLQDGVCAPIGSPCCMLQKQ